MKKPLSLTLRLFLLVSAFNIVTMIVVGLLSLRSANINISEDYDAQLITEASILWDIIEEDISDGKASAFNVESFNAEQTAPLMERMEQDSMLDYAQWRAFRVWRKDKLVMHSDNTDDMPPQHNNQGLSNLLIGKDTWRVFSLHDPQNKIVVETYENLHDRDILQRDILLDVLAPLMIMLPLLGLLFSLGITFGLTGLRKLAGRLATRSPSDLSRLESDDLPKELIPLAQSVNMLLDKLNLSLAHEREFIDHAAHELRTPLSALKLQVQLLAKSVQDDESQTQLLELRASVDRTIKLVEQLLVLSRVAQQQITLESVNLYDVIKDVLTMQAMRIADRQIHVQLEGDERIWLNTQPELIRTLIGNIVDNAVKYTPYNGEIMITIRDDGTRKRVMIIDSGEGIPEAERKRVFERFYRVASTKQKGSGLGLAIANQIAQLLQAEITLEAAPLGPGLAVIITLQTL